MMEPTFSFPNEAAASGAVFGGIILLVIILIGLAINILYVVAYCKIFSKAGYHWAMGLLMLVPIANLIMPLVLAFGQWPILEGRSQNMPRDGYH